MRAPQQTGTGEPCTSQRRSEHYLPFVYLYGMWQF
jgi:hypothetical protein